MANDKPRFADFSQYVALRAVLSTMNCFDVAQNLHTASLVGRIFYRVSARRRIRAIENIARCFPDWPEDRVHDAARRSMEHMFRLFMIDAVATPRLLTRHSWPRHVRIGPLGKLHDCLMHHRPALLLTAHFGNWEVLGQVLALFGYPPTALARPLDNLHINDWLMSMRSSNGVRIITKWGATPIVQRILGAGGRIGIIGDQNAGPQGVFVPFFGRFASSYKSIGILAMRYQVPIAVGAATRVGDGMQFEVSCLDFIEPEDWAEQPDPLFYITARYNRAMEQMVRAAPEQYLWVHRRWKSRPPHEREGRPVPERLVGKLRSLPWLDDDEIERIVDESNRAAAAVASN